MRIEGAEYVTAAEFARRYGTVSPQAIGKAVRRERIPSRTIPGKRGRWIPWPEGFEVYCDLSKIPPADRPVTVTSKPQHPGDSHSARSDLGGQLALDGGEGGSTTEARRRREYYQAENERLKYEEQAGRLVRIEVVEQEWTDILIRLRQAVMAVPDRVASQVAGMDSVTEVYNLLTDELRHALTERAQELEVAASEEEVDGPKS